jgi:hypothetical protein
LNSGRAFKRNFERRNKTAMGPGVQSATSLKIEDLRANKITGKLSWMLYFLMMVFLITMYK